MDLIVYQKKSTIDTIKNPQYAFMRKTTVPTDSLMLPPGLGVPGKECGLVKSSFRSSDDSSALPFPVAANGMTFVNLNAIASIFNQLNDKTRTDRAKSLANDLSAAFYKNAIFNFHGDIIYAYEVDGFGNYYYG